ncbi:MAG: radical SAM protein [Elusimicrobia bacterium]|nr:radical SAM protein [Elusimicrobiota bacterium]
MIIDKWIREWSRRSEFNSFNSWKGLLYSDWYKAIAQEAFLPPVEASLDPIHDCNLMCEHCNAHGYLVDNRAEKNRMPDRHMLKLVRFLGKWGVRGVCFGGGGEPSMHSGLPAAVDLAKKTGMDVSISTNGTLFTGRLIDSMAASCRWVGISIDAASSRTYMHGRRGDMFRVALGNAEKLAKRIRQLGTNCDVAYKFLIFSYNQHEIYKACRIARDIGVSNFHVRPADFCHQGMGTLRKKFSGYDINKIKEQFEKCHRLENEHFRVFTIMHKFDEVMRPKKDFDQCYAAPLCIQLCANGKIYFCPDQRHVGYYELGSHYPDPQNILNIWGNEKHRRLVFKTGRKRCTSRCTMTAYNRQCQELFIKNTDPMCRWFV